MSKRDEIKEKMIRPIFIKHTMPEEGDPELTLFDTEAIIDELAYIFLREMGNARQDELNMLQKHWYDMDNDLLLVVEERLAKLSTYTSKTGEDHA